MARANFRKTGAAQTIIPAPGSSQRIAISKILLTCDADDDIVMFFDTDAEANRIIDGFFGARGGVAWDFGDNPPDAERAKALKITSTGNVRGVIFYRLVS